MAQRHCGQGSCVISGYDPELLELLSPSPLHRRQSIAIQSMSLYILKTLEGLISAAYRVLEGLLKGCSLGFNGFSRSVARDFNLTVADVLAKRPWQRSFAQLPLSTVLNVSRWADFRESAREAPCI